MTWKIKKYFNKDSGGEAEPGEGNTEADAQVVEEAMKVAEQPDSFESGGEAAEVSGGQKEALQESEPDAGPSEDTDQEAFFAEAAVDEGDSEDDVPEQTVQKTDDAPKQEADQKLEEKPQDSKEVPPADQKADEKKPDQQAEQEPGAQDSQDGKPEDKDQKEQEQPASMTQEEFQQQYETKLQERVKDLAENTYAMSDEDYDAFETDPRSYLPKVAARLHVQAEQGAVMRMLNAMPAILNQLQSIQTQNSQTETNFFAAFPALKGHESQVTEIAQRYRQMNPDASPEQATRDIGAMAHIALNIQPAMQQEQQQRQEQQPAQQDLPPHKPAGVSPSSGGAQPATDDNWYTQVADEEMID